MAAAAHSHLVAVRSSRAARARRTDTVWLKRRASSAYGEQRIYLRNATPCTQPPELFVCVMPPACASRRISRTFVSVSFELGSGVHVGRAQDGCETHDAFPQACRFLLIPITHIVRVCADEQVVRSDAGRHPQRWKNFQIFRDGAEVKYPGAR